MATGMSQPMIRYLVWGGSVVLAVTAVFHTTGWSDVVAAADEAQLSGFLNAAVKSLWIYASYHWLFVAVLGAIAAAHPSRLARLVLALSALVLTADAVLLLMTAKPKVRRQGKLRRSSRRPVPISAAIRAAS